jgi:hypothetical protein
MRGGAERSGVAGCPAPRRRHGPRRALRREDSQLRRRRMAAGVDPRASGGGALGLPADVGLRHEAEAEHVFNIDRWSGRATALSRARGSRTGPRHQASETRSLTQGTGAWSALLGRDNGAAPASPVAVAVERDVEIETDVELTRWPSRPPSRSPMPAPHEERRRHRRSECRWRRRCHRSWKRCCAACGSRTSADMPPRVLATAKAQRWDPAESSRRSWSRRPRAELGPGWRPGGSWRRARAGRPSTPGRATPGPAACPARRAGCVCTRGRGRGRVRAWRVTN